jgi:diguanylate cyclase (GGDEF)-like protein
VGESRARTRQEVAGVILLAVLIAVVEVLLVASYLRGSQARVEFGGTSHFLTTLANVQREVLKLQLEVEGVLTDPAVGLDRVVRQRAILESQVRTLAAASDDLPEAHAAFGEALAGLPAIDRSISELVPGREPGAALAAELRASLNATDLDVKHVFDRMEFAYFGRTSATLAEQENAQLLLVAVAVIVAALGAALAFVLRRRVRAEFAHAYYRLEAEMTERIKAQALLHRQAYHDSLTGLANRAQFLERLELEVGDTAQAGIAVLFIDLDDFKMINDGHGHAAGDAVLAAVGGRIADCLRSVDLVARLGGDEFAVLVTDVPPGGRAAQIAARILTAVCHPVAIGGRTHVVSATIGLAEVGRDALGGVDTAAELLRHADVAMYAAKVGGKGRLEVFMPEVHQEAVRRLSLRGELEQAINQNELLLEYQPIVDIATDRMAGVEALVRWRHPDRGLLSPAEFIPVAEDAGLIAMIDGWVLSEACREAARRDLAISVNLSTYQIRPDSNLVQDVVVALRTSGLAPGLLTLELTESVFVSDLTMAAAALGQLKSLGVRLAIDDFGTGFSSFSYLARLPVDVLKIDRSFVQIASDDLAQLALARTIVGLGRTLGIATVAEGIETPEQLAAMRDAGCQYGQGYLFSPPIDLASLDRILSQGGWIHPRLGTGSPGLAPDSRPGTDRPKIGSVPPTLRVAAASLVPMAARS